MISLCSDVRSDTLPLVKTLFKRHLVFDVKCPEGGPAVFCEIQGDGSFSLYDQIHGRFAASSKFTKSYPEGIAFVVSMDGRLYNRERSHFARFSKKVCPKVIIDFLAAIHFNGSSIPVEDCDSERAHDNPIDRFFAAANVVTSGSFPITPFKQWENKAFLAKSLAGHPVYPDTYCVSNAKKYESKELDAWVSGIKPPHFILKPTRESCGRGVRVFSTIEALRDFQKKISEDPGKYYGNGYLVSRYVKGRVVMLDKEPFDLTTRVVCELPPGKEGVLFGYNQPSREPCSDIPKDSDISGVARVFDKESLEKLKLDPIDEEKVLDAIKAFWQHASHGVKEAVDSYQV